MRRDRHVPERARAGALAMSRWLGVTACALAIAASAVGCSGPMSLESALRAQPPALRGRLENDRYTAPDRVWSVAVPEPVKSVSSYRQWMQEQSHQGDWSIEFGGPSSTRWLAKLSPDFGDGMPLPAEAAHDILDEMQTSLTRQGSSVQVLEETESRDAGRAVVYRAWVEQIPHELVGRTADVRIRRGAQVEVRGDRIVVFGLVMIEGEPGVERDPPVPLAPHAKAWRDFIDSFRFEETPAPARTPP
jgi:hypothetical protein